MAWLNPIQPESSIKIEMRNFKINFRENLETLLNITMLEFFQKLDFNEEKKFLQNGFIF